MKNIKFNDILKKSGVTIILLGLLVFLCYYVFPILKGEITIKELFFSIDLLVFLNSLSVLFYNIFCGLILISLGKYFCLIEKRKK